MKKFLLSVLICSHLTTLAAERAWNTAHILKTAGTITLLFLKGTDAYSSYCNKYQFTVNNDGCIAQIECDVGELAKNGGTCGTWKDPSCRPNNLGGKVCTASCDVTTILSKSDNVCDQMEVSFVNDSLVSSACTFSRESKYPTGYCQTFRYATCSKSKDDSGNILIKTAMQCTDVDYAGCFQQDTLAAVKEGDTIIEKPLHALKVSDLVADGFGDDGEMTFIPIAFNPHRDANYRGNFVEVATKNSQVSLTGSHYLPIQRDGIDQNIQADEIEVGDLIKVDNQFLPVVDVLCVDPNDYASVGVEHPITYSDRILVKKSPKDGWLVATTHSVVDNPKIQYALQYLRYLMYGHTTGATKSENALLKAFAAMGLISKETTKNCHY